MVDPITFFIVAQALPSIGLFYLLLTAYFIFRAPRSLKTLFSAWISRGAFVLGFVAGDNGFITIRNMSSKLGQGIFTTGKGKQKQTALLTRPISQVVTDDEDFKEDSHKTALFNQLVKSRYFSDIGKPCYFVYDGKAVMTSPSTIKAIAEAENREPVADDLTLLDPADLKIYFPRAINPSQLDNMEDTAYQRGLNERPEDKIREALPLLVVLAVLLFGYLLLTGKINIPGVA